MLNLIVKLEVCILKKTGNALVLLIVLLIGLVLGGIIGDLLKDVFPILSSGKTIGVDPFELNLGILVMHFGVSLSMSLASIIGLVIAWILYRKL